MSGSTSAAASLDEKEKGVGIHSVVPVAEDYDPKSDEVLQRALRKVDIRLLPPLAILYLFSYLDRGSLANASIFGLKEDLGINGTQYNLLVTVFFFTYGGMEVPGGIIMSYIRPNLWIAGICFTWGVVMTLSGLVQNFGGAIAARLALGIAEASFFPSALMLVGSWYPRAQLQTRISCFYCVGVFSGAFSGLLAYAIHGMDGVAGLSSWRWIFILEGIATVVLSSLILLFLPDAPERSKFLTDEERDAIKANRAAEGDGGAAHFELRYLGQVVSDWKIWACTWLASSVNIIVFGFSYQLPSILVQMGYVAEKAQLMTVPIYSAACLLTFCGSIYSDRVGKRWHMIFFGLSLTLVALILLYTLPKDRISGVRYFASILFMIGIYVCFPGILALNSNNAESRGKRNISVALQMSIASLATAAGTNSYLAKEAPYYPTGFGFGMAMCSSSILLILFLVFMINRQNKRLDEKEAAEYDTATEEERVQLRFRYYT